VIGAVFAACLALTCAVAAPPVRIDTPSVPDLLPSPEVIEQFKLTDDHRRLVAALADPQWLTRESALEEILRSPAGVAALCAMLSEKSLTPESRQRLLVALREELIESPRGALGISMGMPPESAPTRGVEVTQLITGMPASKILRLRDIITHIEGRPIAVPDDLIVLVQSRRPGEEVAVRLSRPRRDERGDLVRGADDRVLYEEQDVRIQLGSARGLLSPGGVRSAESGPVRSKRLAEWALASQRYAPQAWRIAIKDPVLAARLSTGGMATPLDLQNVDGHEMIVSLRADLARIAAGSLARTPERERLWQSQLRRLRDLSTSQSLSADEREHLGRVVERYAQLINQ